MSKRVIIAAVIFVVVMSGVFFYVKEVVFPAPIGGV